MNKPLERVWSRGRDQYMVSGSFAPNGSSALVAANTKGVGFTVVRTSTGLFTITLDDVPYDIISIYATVQLSAGDDKYIQVSTVSLSAGTIALMSWDISGAAATDITANAGNRVNFQILCRAGNSL